MKDELTNEQAQAVLKALDDALEQGPWETSNFLRVIGKNLQEIRDKAARQMAVKADTAPTDANIRQFVETAGQKEVYISLYSSDGAQMINWERILLNLPRQMISRPIYLKEEDVVYFIKSKENRHNEAYVSVIVNQDDILNLSEDKTPRDKFGKSLLTLKDRCISLSNIRQLVHSSGIYQYIKGHLVKQS